MRVFIGMEICTEISFLSSIVEGSQESTCIRAAIVTQTACGKKIFTDIQVHYLREARIKY